MTSVVSVTHSAQARDARLLTAQLDVLAGVVAGVSLGDALAALLQVVETVSADGMLGSVLLMDDDGVHLRHCAAPNLPPPYNEAIDGTAIGPRVGSCGTAAFRRDRIVVEDIAVDPLWEDFRDLALPAGLRACWSTPIIGADGRLLGTFAMYYPQPRRPSTDDLDLIDVLVRTVAMAIERSRADQERERALAAERTAALTLQHSLLSEVPDRIGPVRLEARYRTGDPGVEVGGDWFDAVPVQEGLVVVVGDVQGHDLGAAALMGQLRTVVRAFALEGHPPASILARAGDYLARLSSERLVTVLVVHLDLQARVATVASAGHLPPLLLVPAAGGEGQVDLDVDVTAGPPLGVGDEWPERTTVLPPGGVLFLYTDGLVETRSWSLDEGLERLRSTLRQLPAGVPLGSVLDAALELVPPGSRGDDVAVLAAASPITVAVTEQVAHRWLPPQPMSAPLARSWVDGVLRGWAVDASLIETAALVMSELVTNAARHSEEPVRVRVRAGDDDVLLEVFDRSHRLPFVHESGPEATAGRGLRVVDTLAASWGVREELTGKTVWAVVTA